MISERNKGRFFGTHNKSIHLSTFVAFPLTEYLFRVYSFGHFIGLSKIAVGEYHYLYIMNPLESENDEIVAGSQRPLPLFIFSHCCGW